MRYIIDNSSELIKDSVVSYRASVRSIIVSKQVSNSNPIAKRNFALGSCLIYSLIHKNAPLPSAASKKALQFFLYKALRETVNQT